MCTSGSKAAIAIRRLPRLSTEASQLAPPMCVKGKASAIFESAWRARQSAMPSACTMSVWSVWRAPLGSDVVPDV